MKTIKSFLTLLLAVVMLTGFSQNFKVNTSETTLKWHGKKVTGEHFGTIKLKEGSFTMENNKIAKGNFVIDMASIANTDVEDAAYKAKLEGHLKSDDFFGVEKFPVATLEITGSSAFVDNNASANGQLTIKGITHPVEFLVSKEGTTFSTTIVVDRSKYDVRYGSGSFFEGLGDKLIYDEFTLSVKLMTSK
ncbi:MAG: YceI family protein [Bacteroidales bacterium]|nr:YceI family protein [Bacteroidales bacterium]